VSGAAPTRTSRTASGSSTRSGRSGTGRGPPTAQEVARTVEGLQGQLRDKTSQIQNLERVNKDLQQTVQDLTLQVQQLIQVVRGPGTESEAQTEDANGT